MANVLQVVQGSGPEDSSVALMARVEGADGANITQATVSSIDYDVYESTSATPNTEVVVTVSLTVSSVVFDALQTDSGWDTVEDPLGFNFRYVALPAHFPNGGAYYDIEIKMTMSDGSVLHLQFGYSTAKGLRRS